MGQYRYLSSGTSLYICLNSAQFQIKLKKNFFLSLKWSKISNVKMSRVKIFLFDLTPRLSDWILESHFIWAIFWKPFYSQYVSKCHKCQMQVFDFNFRYLVWSLIWVIYVNYVIVKNLENFRKFISQERHIRISICSAHRL